MKNDVTVEVMVKSIKENLELIVKNHNKLKGIAEYMNDKHDVHKSNIFEVFNNYDLLDKMDITELGLLGERVAFESGQEKTWLLKYFTGAEIVNMRDYKRLDWNVKPQHVKSKKSSFVYNAGFKNAFINTFDKDTIQRTQALGLFRSIGKYELKLNKDLYDMAVEDIENLLTAIGYKSSNSVIRDIVLINKYVNWAVANNFTDNKKIHISTARMDIDKYVYRNLNSQYSKDELFYNLQSSNSLLYLVSMCLFNGIGAVDFDEVRYLKSDNLIHTDDGYFIELDRGLIEIDELFYLQLKHFDTMESLPNAKYKFVETDTIFKAYHRNKAKAETLMNPAVRNRIMNYMKEVMEDDSFTTRTIVRSGMNYFVYNAMKDSGKMIITADILTQVADRFNVHKNKVGYYYGRMLDELNLEFISDTYGEFTIDEYLSSKLTLRT